MKRLYVKVNPSEGSVFVKYGLFGKKKKFSGPWYTEHSINQIVQQFCKFTVADFDNKMSCFVKDPSAANKNTSKKENAV